MRCTVALVVAGVGIVGQSATAGTPGCEPTLISQLGATGHDVAVQGDVAYVAAGLTGLLLLDVADPSAPVQLSKLDAGHYVETTAVAGPLVFAGGGARLSVIDVSDPSKPEALSTTVVTHDWVGDVAVVGDTVYVLTYNELYAVDVSAPSAPVLSATLKVFGAGASLSVRSGVLYVLDLVTGLHVYDITEPSTPAYVRSLAVVPGFTSIAYTGDLAIVGLDNDYDYAVLDMADPLDPQVLSFEFVEEADHGHHHSIGLDHIAIVGNVLWGSDFTSMYAADVTDPFNPIPLTQFDPGPGAEAIVPVGDLLYLALGSTALAIVDPGDGVEPQMIGSFSLPPGGTHIRVGGHHAYLASGGAVYVIDVTNAAEPVQLSAIGAAASVYAMDLMGDYLYIGTWGDGIKVADVSDPLLPLIVAEPPSSYGILRGVAVDGAIAVTVSSYDEVCIYDTVDPADPQPLTTLAGAPFDNPQSVVIHDGLAYVTDTTSGLIVLDLVDPSTPVILSILGGLPNAQHIALVPPHAYIANFSAELSVVDITDPTNPQLVATHPLADSPESIARVGDYLVVGIEGAGAELIDITDPLNPITTSAIDPDVSGFRGVALGNGKLYAAAGPHALRIYDAPGCTASCGDVDGSGLVDSMDLNLVLGSFGCQADCPPVDTDGDGLVGAFDLDTVLMNFGTACASP